MNANHILLGMFVGVMIISLFTPILAVYGFNQTTSMALLYMLPVVGALTAAALDSFVNSKNSSQKEEEPILLETPRRGPEFAGKHVIIESDSGKYDGIVETEDEKMISLSSASRVDMDEPSSMDRVFIERDLIKKIEVLSPGKDGNKSAVCPSGSGSSEIGP